MFAFLFGELDFHAAGAVTAGSGLAKCTSLLEELSRFGVGCCAFSEYLWAGRGEFFPGDWKALYCGPPDEGRRGFGFAMGEE
eukprot:1771710-Pyramimonas_sp.AAC.1